MTAQTTQSDTPAAALLAELTAMDIRLAVDGIVLNVDAPKGTLTPQLLDTIRRHRRELIHLLRCQGPCDGLLRTPPVRRYPDSTEAAASAVTASGADARGAFQSGTLRPTNDPVAKDTKAWRERYHQASQFLRLGPEAGRGTPGRAESHRDHRPDPARTSDPRWPPSCSTTGTQPGRCQAPSMPPWCPHSSASCSEPTRQVPERWLGSKRRSVESSPDLAALTHEPYASSPDQAANPSQSHAKQVPHLPYTKTAIRPTPLSKAKAPPLNTSHMAKRRQIAS